VKATLTVKLPQKLICQTNVGAAGP
jgi:hypothetical protein